MVSSAAHRSRWAGMYFRPVRPLLLCLASLPFAGTHDRVLAARLAGERQQIERIGAGLAKRVFTLPWLVRPPIGLEALSALVRGPEAVGE